MYVDDVMGVSLRAEVAADAQAIRRICTSLLGLDSVQHEKTEIGRQFDFIGYCIDLYRSRVTEC